MDDIIDILLKDFEPNHSEYQIKNFIIGSQVHPWHQYNQCLREIAARHGAIKEKQRELDLFEIETKRRKARGWFKRKTRPIENRAKTLNEIAEIERELNCFLKIAIEIRRQHGFENLSFEKKSVLEAAAWREKAQYMICMDLYCIGRPSKQTIEFIYKLPKEVKRELFSQMMKLNKDNIQNFLIEG
jgi:F0F1-type ATP synthase delta subunit